MHTSSPDKQHEHGFTLVEVLTVIAIIGILASVVLVNLSSSREVARDKYAMATMQSMLIDASLSRANNGDYANVCTDLDALMDDVEAAVSTSPVCTNTATTFDVRVTLLNGAIYCINQTKYFGTNC